MARIFTHAPSKEYDEGWEAVFGKKSLTGEELAEKYGFEPLSEEVRKTNIDRESAKLTQAEKELHQKGTWLPGGGVRMPRGWTPGK